MAELLPTTSLIRLGDRDEELTRRKEANQKAYEESFGGDLGYEAFGAGVRRENYIWHKFKERQALGWGPDPNVIGLNIDPDYMFEDDEANFGYDPMVMLNARSTEEARIFREQIDSEREELRLMAASNWGAVGQVVGSIVQPHVAAGVAFAPISLTAVVAAEVALEAGSEVLLHQMQKTRTLNESYWNVGLTGSFVAILGGAAKGIRALRKEPKDVIDNVNAGRAPGDNDSVGASRRIDKDEITAAEDKLIGGELAEFFSFGQMSHLVQSVSQSARDAAQRLADSPLFTKAHAKGKTRGVTVESLHEAAMGRVVIATDKGKAFAKQSGYKTKMGRPDYNKFDEEVGIAMSNGDRHANPKVQEAAEMYRKEVIDPIREASERLGILDSADDLRAKIKELNEKIGGLEGPEKSLIKVRKVESEAVESARAKYIIGREKAVSALQKKVDAAQKKLDVARKPGKDGKKRTASKELIDKHNKARTELSMHKKETAGKVSGYKERTKQLAKDKRELAVARKDRRVAKAKLDNPVAFAESYFPRIYNKNAIFENWDELRFKIEEHFKANAELSAKLEPGEITELAIDTLQNMVVGRSQRISGKGRPTALRARVLSLMDNELQQYLEKNASSVMVRHAQAMQPYLLMREAFEGRTMDDLLNDVSDDYRKLLADPNISNAQRKKLSEQQTKDKERLQVIHDRLMHQVQRAINPGSATERTIQFAKVVNTATYLGGVVISSLPDIARPLSNYGLRSYGNGMKKAFSQLFSGKGSMPSIQVKRTGAALQRTLNDRVMQLTDSLEPESKIVQGMQKLWSKVSLFGVWTDIMESVATHSAMDWTLRMAGRLVDGKTIRVGDRKQLSRMGLDDEDLIALHGESMGTRGAQDSVLKYMNTMEWKDIDLAKRVEAAIGSDVRRTIIRIGVAEKPQFMDESMKSLMFQFQTFAMSAQNKIMVAGFQNIRAIRTAESLTAMMTIGALVGGFKGYARGEDISEWPPGQWVAEGIDRSGMIGALRIPFNLLRYAGSYTDVGKEFFGKPSRFVGREIEGAVFGPTMSTVGRLAYRAPAAALKGDYEGAAEQLAKATPFANTWHIRNVLLDMGEM